MANLGLSFGFLRSSKNFADRPALEVGQKVLSYGELRERAASLAATLNRRTPAGGGRVDRGLRLPVGDCIRRRTGRSAPGSWLCASKQNLSTRPVAEHVDSGGLSRVDCRFEIREAA